MITNWKLRRAAGELSLIMCLIVVGTIVPTGQTQDLPIEIQADLLRVEAEREQEKLGKQRERSGNSMRIAKLDLELILISAGEFVMGSPVGEADREEIEVSHRVRISNPFWLGKYEVTQGQWEAVMGNNPSEFKQVGKDGPVERVSWEDAVEFCQKVTEMERAAGRLPAGHEYGLPTEEEWEYACRAGSKAATAYGDSLGSSQANIKGDSPDGQASPSRSLDRTAKVGSYRPNKWGLYDMHGNVLEWCVDWVHAYGKPVGVDTDEIESSSFSQRILRGGAWKFPAKFSRSANRLWAPPTLRESSLGFRLCLSAKREGDAAIR